MDCFFSSCKKPADDQWTCDNCYIPKYCSYQCKRKDEQSHPNWCRPRALTLKDFTPVKTSRKLLDIGNYGEVQLMQNTSNSKLYALKLIRKSLISNIIPLKVLFREIIIHKTLVHPNIVRLVDHFEDITKIYLVLEFAEKGSLFDLIRRKIKLSENEACEIFIQTCTGLNFLHQNDIVHRNIKPENLLISKSDTIKICDFGWSAPGLEKKVTFCGTLDYMSPEMINSDPHSTKVDVWAVGILLYEMLHGTPPYRGKNPKEQYRMMASGNYSIGSHVSRSAAQLIRNVLQLRPENRPTIMEVLRSQWVQEYSENQLQIDWKVTGTMGDGLIKAIFGKVVTLNFEGKTQTMLESEVLRKCFIYDHSDRVVHRPPEEESLPVKFNLRNLTVPVTSLYKKLGIDSGRATPISGRVTPVSGKATPTRGSSSTKDLSVDVYEPACSSLYLEVPKKHNKKPGTPFNWSRSATDLKPERAAPEKKDEEVKNVSISKSVRDLNDFKEIILQPDVIPATVGTARTKPKSSFLARFKAK